MGAIRSILVVEDHQDTAELLALVLGSEWGCEVAWAPDAETAMRMIDGQQPDVLLVDLRLPGMNGLQFYDALQVDEAKRSIPVLFLTASPHDARLQARDLNVIGKPFNIDTLLARVEALLSHSSHLNCQQDAAQHPPAW